MERRKEDGPPDSVIGGDTEAGGVVVEATVKDGSAVHELSSEHICAGIVQPHALLQI